MRHSMTEHSNDSFWKGEFGDSYAERSPGNVEANIAFFSRILARTTGVNRILELGAILQHTVGDIDAVVGLLGAKVAEHALGAPCEGIRADPIGE